jgi:hypothetical protein
VSCGSKGRSNRRNVKRDTEASGFIYNGKASKIAGHPWHAALVNEKGPFCGGNLISRTVVVTGETKLRFAPFTLIVRNEMRTTRTGCRVKISGFS